MSMVAKRTGFTLIEVTFAILIVGLGLLTFFSLFPSGLRMAEQDLEDTKCALFSEIAFSAMHANACAMTNASDWAPGPFEVNIVNDVLGVGQDIAVASTNYFALTPGTDDGVRYYLTVSSAPRYSSTLKIWYGRYGLLTNIPPTVTYTEFYQYYQVK